MNDEPRPIPLPEHLVKRSRFVRAVSASGMAGVAVFVVAVVVAVVLVAMRQHEPAVPSPAQVASTEHADQTLQVGAAGRDSAAKQTGPVFVHVVGEVAAPGVVELSAGSRVADAIEAAGGATKQAELSGVNLAREVNDGEQVLVPDADQAEAALAVGAGAANGVNAGDPGEAAGAPVNLNTADQTTLETLPRVGPALAQRIIEWRTANGGFTSIEQLLEVSGIGEKTLAGFRDQVTV